jgi:hypothetical protein
LRNSKVKSSARGLPESRIPFVEWRESGPPPLGLALQEWLYIDYTATTRGWAMMNSMIDGYHAVYFEDVASAVDYCQALVPHLICRGGALSAPIERAVVWFHVPPRSTSSTRSGCYLFASEGALAAAQRAGLETPLCGRVPRAALPGSAVLLFGEDAPPEAKRSRNATPAAARTASPYPRTASRPVDVGA